MTRIGFGVKRGNQLPGIAQSKMFQQQGCQTRFRAASVRRSGHRTQAGQAQGIATPFVAQQVAPAAGARRPSRGGRAKRQGTGASRSMRCPVPRHTGSQDDLGIVDDAPANGQCLLLTPAMHRRRGSTACPAPATARQVAATGAAAGRRPQRPPARRPQCSVWASGQSAGARVGWTGPAAADGERRRARLPHREHRRGLRSTASPLPGSMTGRRLPSQASY